MGETIELTASDGHTLSAYLARPGEPCKGGIVVVQEIFGVNAHIRDVCDRFADAGYMALAPALFDRQKPGFESGYSEEEVAFARTFIQNPDFDAFMRDTEAAKLWLAEHGPVAIVGYCLGGSVAFAAATRWHGLAAAVGYYGGMIVKMADATPLCPTLLHFGETDHSIPMADVEEIKAKRPDVEIHVYKAGHGFNCDHRPSFDADAARVSGERTLAFLDQHMGRYEV